MAERVNPFATNADLREHHARMKLSAANPFASSPVPKAADPTPAPPLPADNSLDELLDRAEELRIEKAEFVARIDALRAAVARDIYEHPVIAGKAGKHEINGRVLTFRRPAARRSADYDLLKAAYPDAYAAAVKVTEPDEDALPSLILGKGFAK